MQKDAVDTYSDAFRWNLLQRKAQQANAARAFVLFRQKGIEPILIKGLAAHRNYPDSHFRNSSDTDLAVPPAVFDAATKLCRSPENHVNIDLHSGLRHLDTLDWDDLFDNSITIDADSVPIRVLRPEDHFRVLCVHWLNDGGAYRERLWDIYYAIENGPADFDWDRCLNVVSETRRRWILCAIGLAHMHLGLRIEHLLFADEAKSLPQWLIRAVEKEWASDVRLTPINMFLRDPRNLLKQIRKRIPPNPIQSTIEMEGSFDAWTRVHYQIAGAFKRLGPSIKKISATLLHSGK